MKKCPDCHNIIPFRVIRAKFKCPHCGIDLKSNEVFLLGIGLVIWFFGIGPLVTAWLSDSAVWWIVVDLIIGVVLLFFMLYLFIKVRIKN